MKADEIEKLIKISDDVANTMFGDYTAWVEQQLEELDLVQGAQLLQPMLHRESAELDSVCIPKYAYDNNNLVKNLSDQTSHQNVDIVFRAWYESFLLVLKDSAFLHDIIRHEPRMIYDEQFIHGRSQFESGRDPNYYGLSLMETCFYWNVHVLVLAYLYHKIKRLSFLKSRTQEYSNVGSGLHCNLSPTDKRTLFSKLVAGKYIHDSTTVRNFAAAMTPEPLPYGFKRIKWILPGRGGNPHKTAFREFLESYCQPGQHGRAPSQNDIDRVFEDSNGNSIELSKPTRAKPSNYMLEIEGFLR